MLELKNVHWLEDGVLYAEMTTEGQTEPVYELAFSVWKEQAALHVCELDILRSNVPDEYRTYQTQAMIAVHPYLDRFFQNQEPIPDYIPSMWV